jgi:site-specific DNA-methyltransferase (adenine-specific)
VGRKPYIPFSDYISKMMIDMGFNMRGEIIWNKGSSAGVSMAWGSWKSASNPILRDVHEYILIFSKGSYRSCSSQRENTITKEEFMEWTKSVWTMSAESARKVGHPAPFPEELPRRLIHLYSFKNDVVLDPFMGSGTTAVAALNAGRRYVGYDNNPEYVKLAEKRLSVIKRQAIFSFGGCPRRTNSLQTGIKTR